MRYKRGGSGPIVKVPRTGQNPASAHQGSLPNSQRESEVSSWFWPIFSHSRGWGFLIGTLCLPWLAHGTLSLTPISGYSSIETEKSTLRIFGGIAGSASNCSGTGTCNNCESTARESTARACNPNRIYSNTQFHVDLISDSASGVVRVYYKDDSELRLRDTYNSSAGTTTRLSIEWRDICDASDKGGPNCDTNSNVRLTIGVDGNDDGDLSDSEDDTAYIQFFITKPEDSITIDTVGGCNEQATNGVCDFNIFPGDEKIYIDSVEFGQPNFNSAGQVNFNRIRVYVSKKGFASTLPGLSDTTPTDLELESTSNKNEISLNDKVVDGLENEVTYFFRLAVMDEANNIAYFTREEYMRGVTVNGSRVCDRESGAFNPNECPYTATPKQVVGLLSEDVDCFIATATYGSKFSSKVKTFRQFRDRFLLPHKVGKRFVNTYYKYSPLLAQWIAPREVARKIAHVFLWPAWIFAAFSLKWGVWTTTFIFFLVISFFLSVTFILLKKRWHHAK